MRPDTSSSLLGLSPFIERRPSILRYTVLCPPPSVLHTPYSALKSRRPANTPLGHARRPPGFQRREALADRDGLGPPRPPFSAEGRSYRKEARGAFSCVPARRDRSSVQFNRWIQMAQNVSSSPTPNQGTPLSVVGRPGKSSKVASFGMSSVSRW